jgi:hypothetical protein
MGKALVFFAFVMVITAWATRTDCGSMTDAQCERANRIVDGMIE